MIEEILKIFTRHVIPGVTSYFLIIVIPILLYGIFTPESGIISNLFGENGFLLSAEAIILISIILGFLLDGIGAYAYTFHAKDYNDEKTKQVDRLSEIKLSEQEEGKKYKDPDMYTNKLWAQDEELYDRIFHDRAEWVSILNTACAFLISAFVTFTLFLYSSYISPCVHTQYLYTTVVWLIVCFTISCSGQLQPDTFLREFS